MFLDKIRLDIIIIKLVKITFKCLHSLAPG